MRLWLAVMSLCLAMSSTARADAEPPRGALVLAHAGKVLWVDPAGERVLTECTVTSEITVIRTGEKIRETQPCPFGSFASHPGTGRWMATVFNGPHRTLSLSGRVLEAPRDRKGQPKEGDFLLFGDARGLVAVSTGVPRMWTEDGSVFAQFASQFTPEGDSVLVRNMTTRTHEWWSWSFGPTPQGHVVLPAGETDVAGNELVADGSRTVLRSPRHGVRVADFSAGMARPWKLGRRLPLERDGMLTPVILGDVLLYYREGRFDEAGCDERSPGTYRRYDLSTGRESTWRQDEGVCSTSGEPFVATSAARGTTYFMGSRDSFLYEYTLATDTVSRVAIDKVQRVLDLSADGRLLLVATWDGLIVYDVVQAQRLWRGDYYGKELALKGGFAQE